MVCVSIQISLAFGGGGFVIRSAADAGVGWSGECQWMIVAGLNQMTGGTVPVLYPRVAVSNRGKA